MLSKGSLLTGQTITPRASVSEFIVRTPQTVLALVDSSTGNFKIKGKLYANAGTISGVPDKSFVIRSGPDMGYRAFINSEAYDDWRVDFWQQIPAGSLIIKGSVWSLESE